MSTPSAIPAPPDNQSYASLKRLIVEKGLLEKQPGFLTYKILLSAAMLALSLLVLFLTDNVWLQLLNAVFLGTAFPC